MSHLQASRHHHYEPLIVSENTATHVPTYVVLQESDYKHMGVLIAMSIVQGSGSGFPVFTPHIFSYIATGELQPGAITNEDVPDPSVRLLLEQVSTIACR